MKPTLFLLLACATLVGCAQTRTQVMFDYHPEPRMQLGSLSGASIREVRVTDRRFDAFLKQPLADSRILLRKRNGYDRQTQDVYVTDKPLPFYIQEGFDRGLTKAAVLRSASSPMVLVVRIDKFDDPAFEQGAFKLRKLLLTIGVTVELHDDRSNSVIWRQRYAGESEMKLDGIFFSVDNIAWALPFVIDDVVSHVMSSPAFEEALRARINETDV